MNILNLLRPDQSMRHNYGFKALIPSKSGKMNISVICGESIYSNPRENLENPKDYKTLEIALFNAETMNWASYNEASPVFAIIGNGEYCQFEWDDNNEEIERDLNVPQSAVFAYVTVEDISKVWETL